MQVFISWSGELSKQIGECFRLWLPGALQMVKPYFTPADIDKGARWQSEIAKELEASKVGVFCVTRESLGSGWLLFEAGALSKSLDKAHVCPVLFGVEEAELPTPLSQFQTTRFEQQEIWQLFKTINSSAEAEKLRDNVLESVFNKWWPDLERDVNEILRLDTTSDKEPLRSEREIMEEVLTLSRHLVSRVGSPSLPPSAVRDLVSGFIEAHDVAKKSSSGQGFLETLEAMHKSVGFLLRLSLRGGGSSLSELYERFETLDFEYPVQSQQPPFTFDDEDIPF